MPLDLPSLIPPRFEQHRLDNGLELLLAPDPSAALIGLELAYRTGSRDDPPGRGGLAHLFEHMLFQGSANVGPNEHFAQLERIGGIANASTSRDRTVYWEAVPAGFLDLALWLESDRLGFLLPGLVTETLETQRGVVLAERAQRVDNQPWGRASEAAGGILWPEHHPYHRPVIGAAAEIRAITLDDARVFFERHYRPRNAVLCVVGGSDADTVRHRVEHWFGEIGGGNPPAALPPTPPASPPQRLELEDHVPLARVWLSWPLPPAGDPSHAVAEMAAAALGGGRSSPLYDQLVRQRGLAQDVAAGVSPGDLGSGFVVVATARPGVDPTRLEAALLDLVASLADPGPAPADLARAGNGAVVSLLSTCERAESLADLLCLAHTRFGDVHALDAIPRRWLAVTPAMVRTLAAERLRPEAASVVWCRPEVG
jgi:zinc protease